MKLVSQKHGGKINQLEKGETANPNGRPRKMVSTVLKELKEQGIERVKAFDIIELIETFINLSIKELGELANDDKQSWIVRQTAKNMLKDGNKAWNELQDRAHGKAKQLTDIDINVKEPLIIKVETEEQKKKIESI